MGDSYPKISRSEWRKKNTSARCIVCNAVADKRSEIQTSPMRGDDELVWHCGYRKHRAEEIIQAYMERGARYE